MVFEEVDRNFFSTTFFYGIPPKAWRRGAFFLPAGRKRAFLFALGEKEQRSPVPKSEFIQPYFWVWFFIVLAVFSVPLIK